MEKKEEEEEEEEEEKVVHCGTIWALHRNPKAVSSEDWYK